MKRLLCGLVALGLLLGGVVQADYIYTSLDVSILGALPGTQAFGINDAGQVVGSYPQYISKGRSFTAGFLFSGAAYTRDDGASRGRGRRKDRLKTISAR
jgi:hypothetical protein